MLMFFDSFELQSKLHDNDKPLPKKTKANKQKTKTSELQKSDYLKENEWETIVLSSSFLAGKKII